MNKLVAAFHTAWTGLKKGLAAADSFVQNNLKSIQGGFDTGVAIAEKLDPAATPLLDTISGVEHAAVSEIAAAIHSGNALVNSSDGSAQIVLSAELYGSIKALTATLSAHPAVVAASAAS